jgi:hypothetical protein
MTLDVIIGKYERIQDKIIIHPCAPVHFDVCNPQYTLWEREAYRSGSTGFYEFFKYCVGALYYEIRSFPNSSDAEIIRLRPIIDKINNLPMPDDLLDKDRMVWLKYWTNRAVSLYGNEAVIGFS